MIADNMPTIKDLLDAASGPKMLEESLCVVMTDLDKARPDWETHMRRLLNVCQILDECRPLANNGKHGNLHTQLCGCEDINTKFTQPQPI